MEPSVCDSIQSTAHTDSITVSGQTYYPKSIPEISWKGLEKVRKYNTKIINHLRYIREMRNCRKPWFRIKRR